ncbi:MAG: DUF1206 domain-containing protein [Phormidesmis sp.]
MYATTPTSQSSMSQSDQTQASYENWISYYARFGYAAKGVLYGSIGLLALLEALNVSSGKTVGSEGVLKTIAAQPYGQVLLAVLAVSLTGYVVWRFIQAFVDPEHGGHEAKDILRRVGYACSGLVYASVAFSALKILTASSSDGGKTTQEWVLTVMQQPFGRWLVGAGGLLFFGLGCYYFYRAIKAKFRKRFKLHEMSDVERTWATIIGRVGVTARGVVYVIIGIFAMRAAWTFDPSEVKTTEGVLAVFNSNPADEIILSILGIGFIAYGVHMGFQARYRRIQPKD